jgi:hypothetical protein
MIGPPANDDSTPAIGDIAKLQVECLSWAKATIEHQAKKCSISLASQLGEDPFDLIARQGSGQPAYRLYAEDARRRTAALDAEQEGSVAIGHVINRALARL